MAIPTDPKALSAVLAAAPPIDWGKVDKAWMEIERRKSSTTWAIDMAAPGSDQTVIHYQNPVYGSYTVAVPRPVTTMADIIYRTTGRKVALHHVYELDLEELVRRQWERTRAEIEANLAETCWGGSNQMPPVEPLTAAKLIEICKRISP